MTGQARRESMLTEADFQRRIIDLARLRGWRVVHIRPAWVRSGRMVTPYEGHAGLPDLVLARRGVVLLAELKAERGKPPTGDQLAWLAALGDHGRLWRPRDWPDIEKALQ